MNIYAYINPQLFADEGAAAAPAGGGAETGTAAEAGTEAQTVNVGDTLSDGSQVQDPQVAAAMNRRLKQSPELREAFFGQRAEAQGTETQQAPENGTSLEERYAELRKGEFKDMIAQDIQRAVKDRFKNQEDANAKLNAMQPMFDALMKKTGAESIDELSELILNDDSLYEEEAEEAGMPVAQYREFKQLQDEHNAMIKQQQKQQEQQAIWQHLEGLKEQAEQLKQIFPDFDFQQEIMNNERFRDLTSPDKGLSVEEAYYAIHHNELVPQMLSYGMQRAQQQMGQTIMAQKARPAEGAMSGRNPAAAEPRINPKNLTRKEREYYKDLIRMDKFTSFDR